MSFHFLRPEWLLTLLPILLLLWKSLQQHSEKGNWDHFIDPNFRKILLGDQTQKKPFPWPIMGLAIIWLSSMIALSGPSWQSVKMPAEKNLQGSVIVFDLSLSMLADDLKPNRITRATYKIRDLLEAHPEYAMGMVGYAGTAHTIAPISQDNQTLLSLTPVLNPMIMPLYGSNVVAAFQKAQQLLQGAKVKQGHIIWVTDDLEGDQIAPLTEFLKRHSISLSILAVGTENGGPISIPEYGLLKDDQGKIVLPKLPYTRLVDFADRVNANLVPISLENDDLDALLPSQIQVSGEEEKQGLEDQNIANWLDEGIYFLLLLVPLVALAFRRGWLLSMGLLLILPLGILQPQNAFAQAPLSPSEANTSSETSAKKLDNNAFMPELLTDDKKREMKFSDAFVTPDRLGYLLWKKQDYARAEKRFENPEWKGASDYRLGKYQQAAEQFSLSDSANSQYNLGNSLAQLGQLKQAKQAYEKALQTQPDHKPAKQNLALVNQLIKQIEAQKKQENPDNQPNSQQKQGAESQKSEPGAQQQSGKQDPSKDQSPHKKNAQQQARKAQQEGEDGQQGENQGKGDDPKQSSQSGQAQSDQNANQSGASSNQTGQNDAQPNASKASLNTQQPLEKQSKNASMSADTDQDIEANDEKGKQDPLPSKLAKSKQNQPGEESTDSVASRQHSGQTEQEQAQQAWLNQIPDEPGLFLKRKFDYQYQNQPTQSNSSNEKIW